MGRLLRLVVAGAAARAAARWAGRLVASWQQRSAADIRRSVESRLPASIDPETRQRISRSVTKAIKGAEPVRVEEEEPTARTLSSPPSPPLPSDRDEE